MSYMHRPKQYEHPPPGPSSPTHLTHIVDLRRSLNTTWNLRLNINNCLQQILDDLILTFLARILDSFYLVLSILARVLFSLLVSARVLCVMIQISSHPIMFPYVSRVIKREETFVPQTRTS